jgi:hypothetical protein
VGRGRTRRGARPSAAAAAPATRCTSPCRRGCSSPPSTTRRRGAASARTSSTCRDLLAGDEEAGIGGPRAGSHGGMTRACVRVRWWAGGVREARPGRGAGLPPAASGAGCRIAEDPRQGPTTSARGRPAGRGGKEKAAAVAPMPLLFFPLSRNCSYELHLMPISAGKKCTFCSLCTCNGLFFLVLYSLCYFFICYRLI